MLRCALAACLSVEGVLGALEEQHVAKQVELRQQQEAAQRKEARRLRGTGFSSIKEVDNSWSRFGFVPKPSNTVGDAAGPSGAAAGPSQLPDEVVEI